MRGFFGEAYIGLHGPALEVVGWDDSHNTLIVSFIFLKLFLKIPQWLFKGYTIDKSYGFNFTQDSLHMHWGEKTKLWWYPWTWDHYRTSVLRPDGTIWKSGNGLYGDAIPAVLKEQHTYNYLMRDGSVQACIATVHGVEMEWRMRCAKWFPWIKLVRRTIGVSFSEQMGPNRGTWKGDVIGTGFEWKPGDTLQQAVRKMERALEFN
jgi:hypothetical protein